MPTYKSSPDAVYRAWHWGIPHTRVKHVDAPGLGDKDLIEIGRLLEVRFRPLAGGREVTLALDPAQAAEAHACFDLRHPSQRIYLVMPRSALRDARALYGDCTDDDLLPLVDVATAAGGRHGRMTDYPDVLVKPLGRCTNLVYGTQKKGDDAELDEHGKAVGIGSGYVHRMGEDGGIEPVLCVSKDGQLWLAGGSYTCPTPGITK